MPIFRFLAVTGAILVALLFVADATLTPRKPQFTNESYGLPRSEPMQPKEAARPRAPALVQVEPPQSIIAAAAPAAVPAPAPLAAAAETTGAAPAAALNAVASAAQARAEASKIETAKVESARSKPARIQPANTETARIRTAKAAPTKPRKQTVRKPDRSGDFAASRDGQQARDHRGPVENGYAYGVQPWEARAERRDWQREWIGGDFGQNRGRF